MAGDLEFSGRSLSAECEFIAGSFTVLGDIALKIVDATAECMNAPQPHDPCGIFAAFDGCTNLVPFHVEALERLGVPADALAGPTPVRVGFVRFNSDVFEFADDHPMVEGEPVFVFLVVDQFGEPVDLVACAWKSGKVATWLRRAFALGEAKIHAPRLSDHGALCIHRTPLE